MSFFRFFGFEFYCCGVGCVFWLVGWFLVVGMGSNLGRFAVGVVVGSDVVVGLLWFFGFGFCCCGFG